MQTVNHLAGSIAREYRQEGSTGSIEMTPRWLVTGGAGYIGAHVVRDLLASGFQVEVLDDLSTGNIDRLPSDVSVHRVDLLDRGATLETLRRVRPGGVIHLAGKKQARESYSMPLEYWSVNLMGTASLLEAMVAVGTPALLFSSSCSVYGSRAPVTEDSPIAPESPYGESKAAAEMLIRDVARTSSLKAISLRYFNVIGCAEFPGAHDVASDSVIPRMVGAASRGEPLPVYGTDRATPDGSCLRDYIDVRDIARAHVVLAEALAAGREVPEVCNASTGRPVSVLEMASAVNAAMERESDAIDVQPSHPADPSEVWAAQSPLLAQFGWTPEFALESSIAAHLASVRAGG